MQYPITLCAVIGTFTLSACASSGSVQSKVSPVTFKTQPAGAQINVQALFGEIATCDETPCELYLPVDTSLSVKASKQGYLPRQSYEYVNSVNEVQAQKFFYILTKIGDIGPTPTSMVIPFNCDKYPDDVDKLNHEPIPCIRLPPMLPPRAEKSGHCNMRYDVDIDGRTKNIEALYCSAKILEASSISAVQAWTYYPAIKGGNKIAYEDVESRIIFVLTGENGDIVPE